MQRQFSEENIGFSTNDSGATGYLCAKINNTIWIIDLNVKPKITILLDKTIGWGM